MRTKKAAGHIEMIFSFLIFIGFLGFAFLYLNPFAQTASQVDLNDVESAIKGFSEINLEGISLSLNKTTIVDNPPCFYVNISVSQKFLDGKVIIKNSTSVTGANISSEKLYIHETKSPASPNIYYISASDELKSILTSPQVCKELEEGKNYTFGGLRKSRVFSYKNLTALHNFYNADYLGLKTRLGLNKDFSFLVYENRIFIEDLSGTRKTPLADVVSSSFQIDVLNETGDIKSYNLVLRAW